MNDARPGAIASCGLIQHCGQAVRAEQRVQRVGARKLKRDREAGKKAEVVREALDQWMAVVQMEVHHLADGADPADQSSTTGSADRVAASTWSATSGSRGSVSERVRPVRIRARGQMSRPGRTE